jgi:hypothetical protein
MLLDWRDPSHWNGGKVVPCRWCGRGCWTLDDAGRPAHKSCVEAQLEPIEGAGEVVSTVAALTAADIALILGPKCPVCRQFICGCEAAS